MVASRQGTSLPSYQMKPSRSDIDMMFSLYRGAYCIKQRGYNDVVLAAWPPVARFARRLASAWPVARFVSPVSPMSSCPYRQGLRLGF
ncbi:Uncharacterised protein [Bordetella pertussis]|nr:Uncharacterised protein [Bordetella pertussis]CFV97022.1 Uncharacterised protein [Bordetella pertussis]CFW35028.1 Uncharacterised protein [Bordetella pertussis]